MKSILTINFKPYRALFRIRFTNSLQYRAAAFAGLATQFSFGLMFILAFAAFYRSNPYSFPMTFQQTVTYIWLQQAFLALFFIWFYEYRIFESIESGSIAYEMVRPMDLYSRWFSMTAANRVARTLLRSAPLIAAALILPHPFRLVIPFDIARLGLFLISMALTLGVVLSFSMLVYISSFYTINSAGTRLMAAVASDFLAGGTIPIPFFPDTFRTIVELLPFGSMQNMPLLIFSGHIYGTAAFRGIGLQMFWVVALIIIGRFWMSRALKRVVAQGG
ncbi:MAG: ABC transporter permease [Defluviitaleaceae bacterium]|nr:ABC transporter permease [Defluviitaleaceae bacterium]